MSKDVKSLAKNLGKKAKELGLEMTHSQSLELLAFTKGYSDWNAYSSTLKINVEKITTTDNKGLPEIAMKCINLADALNQGGGLMYRMNTDVAKRMNIEVDDVEEILEEASNYLEEKKECDLNVFYKKFQENKLRVYEFIVNEESFYVVGRNKDEAKGLFEKDPLINDQEEAISIRFKQELNLQQLKEFIFYDDSLDINPSFLEHMSTRKDTAPYILAKSYYY